jgi:hypothetical protein
MSESQKNSATSSQPPSKQGSSGTAAISKQLDKDADEMANSAGKVEQKYDENHNIFTK